MKILLIGKSSGRLHALAEALYRSPQRNFVDILSDLSNPALAALGNVTIEETANPARVAYYAKATRPDFALISNEEPLAAGVTDCLNALGIPTIGPTQALAQIETSKSFARNLLATIPYWVNPTYQVFDYGRSIDEISSFMRQIAGEFVVKPDGLTGGKGVRVMGDHFQTITEALDYCKILFKAGQRIVVEQKMAGEEFSLMSFCDGLHVRHMIPIQDHKRVFDNDRGPNTGGMGSYSCPDHLLPFLQESDVELAQNINSAVVTELQRKIGEPYKGIIYGNYILTANGPKIIEFNARFGDPEALNALTLLETDFVDVCGAIINGHLNELAITFAKKASVCKYLVPDGYPGNPVRGVTVVLPQPIDETVKIYWAGINGCLTTGSRTAAFVGIGETLAEAEQISEEAIESTYLSMRQVTHRSDIGTKKLIQKKIDHMKGLTSSLC